MLASAAAAAPRRRLIVFSIVFLLFLPLSMTMVLVAAFSSSSPMISRSVAEMEQMEATVRRYFQGVNEKDPYMIYSCFGETATIRDVCALNSDGTGTGSTVAAATARTVQSVDLVQRCMDFLTAHPDCLVQFHYGPECGRLAPHWVFVHWYETGTWTGTSQGISPPDPHLSPFGRGANSKNGRRQRLPMAAAFRFDWTGISQDMIGRPMAVEGQTRFRVDPDKDYTIQEMVVTRTFSEWEKALLEREAT